MYHMQLAGPRPCWKIPGGFIRSFARHAVAFAPGELCSLAIQLTNLHSVVVVVVKSLEALQDGSDIAGLRHRP